MTRRKTAATAKAIMIALGLLVFTPFTRAQSGDAGTPPSLVEVYWKSSKTIVSPGITDVVVLDPEVTRAEAGADTIQFFGLQRGETVAMGYVNGAPVSMRIRVIERPPAFVAPSLLRRRSEMAQGIVATSVQTSSTGGATSTTLLNSFNWTQSVGSDGRFTFNSQAEENGLANGRQFNLRRAEAVYQSPTFDLHAIDFSTNLASGGLQHHLNALSLADSVELRGLNVTLKHGQNQYSFFGGTTIPFFYLTLDSTRDIAGFTFQRQQSEKLGMFSTTSFVNAPVNFFGTTFARRNNIMETAGFTYLLDKHWTVQSTGGASNHGGLGRGDLSYVGNRVTGFVGGAVSAPLFPLNQIQSLFAGTSSIKAGATFKNNEWSADSFYYQHSVTKQGNGILQSGSSDYISPGLWLRLARGHDANVNYTYSRNEGGFTTGVSTSSRIDISSSNRLTDRISNSAQVTFGALQDPLQVNSEDRFAVREGISFPVKAGNMLVTVSHEHTNPSLVSKINSELNLLSPALQAQFLKDPVAFVDSQSLPPEIRALLEAHQPVSTSVAALANLSFFNKLTVNPSFSVAHAANGPTNSWTPFAGYGLIYMVRPTVQISSSLSNVWFLASNQNSLQRTMLFSAGVTKSFNVIPVSVLPGRHTRIIEGRVFRDNNINGYPNPGEPGFGGIQVQLESGENVFTDELGRYKFTGVSAGEHRVSISLTQFREPVRMTTRNEAVVDLIRQGTAVVNFGVINFARLTGNVFNDLRFAGKRQPDSKGLREVRLVLDDGKQKRTITTSSAGDYEISDLSPGDYKLTVDATTLPANYVLAKDTFDVHVAPVSTVVQDVPAKALRSIAGRVMLKVLADGQSPDAGKLKIGGMPPSTVRSQQGGKAGQAAGQGARSGQQGAGGTGGAQDFNLVPMAGVQLTAGFGVVKTDANGNFLLRDLPAGDLVVTLVPLKALPADMKLPSGQVRMPAEPIQVEGATIVISNPELVPYLLDKTAAEVRDSALPAAQQGNTAKAGTGAPGRP